jgi:hypothetical protein
MEEFMRRLHLVAIASFMLCAPASAADICKAIALRDVPALEAPESVLKRGEYDTAITQYRMNKKTGMTSFCSHGGYCYPTHVIENGAKVEVLRLTNCKIGKRDEWDDPEEIFYNVDVLKSALSETEQKIDELDNKLLDLGLCSACASNVAHFYVRQPQSRCAALTRKALGGDAQALETLKQDPDYCR